MKKCKSCGVEKAVDQFYKRNDRPVGLQAICKECRRQKYGSPRHHANRAKGLCSCGRECVVGLSKCEPCRTAQNKRSVERTQELKAEGICITCRKTPATDGYSECDPCATRRGERVHGVNLEVREILFRAQGGKCPICGKDLEGYVRRKHAVVDHCHTSGSFRGLLHDRCNLLVSNLDFETAERIAIYLKPFRLPS